MAMVQILQKRVRKFQNNEAKVNVIPRVLLHLIAVTENSEVKSIMLHAGETGVACSKSNHTDNVITGTSHSGREVEQHTQISTEGRDGISQG